MPPSTARRLNPALARARPLLGTTVSIRIEGLEAADGHALIDRAFDEIGTIHRLMSFQEPGSELSRINRHAVDGWVAIDSRTEACVRRALDFARLSDGVFDPTAAGAIGAAKRVGNWRDIEIDDGRVRFAAPVLLDLSGLAKGFAVDRSCALLAAAGAETAVVNAGGDLRLFGAADEPVALCPFDVAEPAVIEVTDGAIASSDPRISRAQTGVSCHVDGRSGRPLTDGFVCVAAPTCMDADALTKIVLAWKDRSRGLLDALGAVAYVHDDRGWTTIGGGG